jgi:hypothetical protein
MTSEALLETIESEGWEEVLNVFKAYARGRRAQLFGNGLADGAQAIAILAALAQARKLLNDIYTKAGAELPEDMEQHFK